MKRSSAGLTSSQEESADQWMGIPRAAKNRTGSAPSQAARLPRLLGSCVLGTCLAAGMAAQGTNVLANPGFDGNADGWRLFSSAFKETSWSVFDQAGPGNSGSVYAVSRHPDERISVTSARQCVPVVEGMIYDAGSFFFEPAGQATQGRGEVVISWRREADCVSLISEVTVRSSGVLDAWTGTFGQVAAPDGARSAAIDLKVHKVEAGGLREVFFDNVYFAPAGPAPEPCALEPGDLCIGERFRAKVSYRAGEVAGVARAVPLDLVGLSSGGMFWFFSPDNPELLLKVLDGCSINGHYWVFYSAGTDVEFEVVLVDLETQATWTSFNPEGTLAPPVADIQAFGCSAPPGREE